MSKIRNAKLVLVQIESMQTGDFTGRVADGMTLANEVMRNAKALAEEILKEEAQEEAKAA